MTIAPYLVRLAGADDLPSHTGHLLEHIEENGDGGIHYAPFSKEDGRRRFADPDRAREWREGIAKRVDEPGWRRIFLTVDDSGRIVGHADLTGGSLAAELHRCRLGIGLLSTHRRRGLGEALLRAAIDWARSAGLRWMDLGVFAANEPAIALYGKLGFVEVGRLADRFRIDGISITDVLMVLRLDG